MDMKKILLLCLIAFSNGCFARPDANTLAIAAPGNLSALDKKLFWANFHKYVELRERKRYEESIIYLDKAIELSLKDSNLWIMRAVTNISIAYKGGSKKFYKEALRDYDQALDLKPSQDEAADIYYQKSLLHLELNDENAAYAMLVISAELGNREVFEMFRITLSKLRLR